MSDAEAMAHRIASILEGDSTAVDPEVRISTALHVAGIRHAVHPVRDELVVHIPRASATALADLLDRAAGLDLRDQP